MNELSPGIPVFVFSNVYLNTPATNRDFNTRLISAVKEIGRIYGTVKGSDLKKGIHYIFHNTSCPSKRQIKMMLMSVPNAIIRDKLETDYIYRCSKDHFVEVFEFIIEKAQLPIQPGQTRAGFYLCRQVAGINYVISNSCNPSSLKTANKIIKGLTELG